MCSTIEFISFKMDFSATDAFFSFFQGESAVLQFIGKWGYSVYEERDVIQMGIHMILSALFAIYIGSHASLRRPPSAAVPLVTKSEEDDDLEFVEVEEAIEGLSPSDAIIMPITASLCLGGLYFLIKWLRDPKLLNRIIGWYCSGIGVFGVGKMVGDGLHVATTFLFPSVWSDRHHQTFYIEPLLPQRVEGRQPNNC
jgi:minor histocompatibility antigen H13